MQTQDAVGQILEDAYQRGGLEDENGAFRELAQTAMRRDQGEEIQRVVREAGARRTIETGFALGLSGLHMVKGMLAAGSEAPRHYAADPTEDSSWNNVGLEAFQRAGVRELLEFANESSAFVLPRLFDAGAGPFDVALVDGGHHFDNAFLDLFYMEKLVKPEGLVIVDDMWMPAVRWAADYFERNRGWTPVMRFPEVAPAKRRGFAWGKKAAPEAHAGHVVFRMPPAALERPWDHFEPFGQAASGD